MRRSLRTILIVLAALFTLLGVAWLGVNSGLAHYDQRTRERILEQVAAEVPLGSDVGVMEEFMRKHTQSYSVDDTFDHLYAGLLPQSRLDRILGNRKVIVRLRFDQNRRFKGSEVLIAYQTI
jgi:hypothetical protein